jgi:CysZ protein
VLKDLIISIQAYFQAHRFIKQHRLWKWIIIPGIIYAVLFVTGMYYFMHTSSQFIEWLSLKTGLKNWLDTLSNSFLGFIFTMGSLLLWLILLLFYFSLFKYLFLIIGSPVFAYLSEKTEAIIEGKDIPFNFSQLLEDIIRGIKLAARNSLWQTVYTVTILFLSLIPLLGWLTPVLAILIECYYYGFSMLDYSMARHKKSPAASIFYVSSHKGLAIGNGIVFYLFHFLPIIGWVLAPAYAVIAATLSMYPLKQSEK